jgi:hypothetical protein
MVDELTLNFMVILHGTTQTRCIVVPNATDNPHHPQQCLLSFLRSCTIVWHQCCPEFAAKFIQPTHREKQDLTPTNQNTRSRTSRHSISCILVPRHGHTHINHSRRLKSPIQSKFSVLDPFYPRHFAFPFGLPTVPYRRGGTQCPKMDLTHKKYAKFLKHGATIFTCD